MGRFTPPIESMAERDSSLTFRREKRARPLTLLIAKDQRIFRQSLRLLLEREPDLIVVGEATDG